MLDSIIVNMVERSFKLFVLYLTKNPILYENVYVETLTLWR